MVAVRRLELVSRLDRSDTHGKERKGRYKDPWVSSRHGWHGEDAPLDEFEQLAQDAAERCGNGTAGILALGERLPQGVLGIDVDAYDGKNGQRTLSDWEAQFGPLPATYRVTARRDGVSGILLYRVPIGYYPKETPNSGVEFLDHHHRYMAAPPSWHHTGRPYRLILPNGKRSKSGLLPLVDEIPMLPQSYLDGLPANSAQAEGRDAEGSEVAGFATRYDSGPQPEAVHWIISATINSPDAEGTYNPTRDALCWAAREAKGGRFGWSSAADEIHRAARRAYETRGSQLDEADFARLVSYAVGQVRDTDEEQLYDAWQQDRSSDDTDPFADPDSTEKRIEQLVAKELERHEVRRRVALLQAQKLLDASADQTLDGVAFLESGIDADPLWGAGSDALMAPGQGSMVFGTDGAGKSSIMQQVVFARLGLSDDEVLGFPVQQSDQPVLYLALDRPEQIRRSIGRMVDLNDPAVRDGAVPSNPVLPGPRRTTKRRAATAGTKPFAHHPLSANQVAAISDWIAREKDNDVYALAVLFAAHTGVRAAELQGLQVQDVALSDHSGTVGSIRVVRTASRHGGQWIEGTPKSDASTNRVVPLTPWLADELRDYLATIHPFAGQFPHAPLFPGRRSRTNFDWAKPVVADNLYDNYLQPAVKALGLGSVRFHDLRHTFATMNLSAGEHYMQVSKWLGHSSFVLTLSTYADYIREDELAAPKVGRGSADAKTVMRLQHKSA